MPLTVLRRSTLSPPYTQPAPQSAADLQALAEFLAAEFHHDAQASMLASVAWFQLQVGADLCSFDDAAELRYRTLDQVTALRASVAALLPGTLAEVAGRLPAPTAFSEQELAAWQRHGSRTSRREAVSEFLNGLGLLAAMLVLLGVCFLGGWAAADDDLPPDDPQPIAQPAGLHVAQAGNAVTDRLRFVLPLATVSEL